jgi:hypothetical protein
MERRIWIVVEKTMRLEMHRNRMACCVDHRHWGLPKEENTCDGWMRWRSVATADDIKSSEWLFLDLMG